MKKKMIYMAFALVVVAVSVAQARGRRAVFTFAVHPLSTYAGQIQ